MGPSSHKQLPTSPAKGPYDEAALLHECVAENIGAAQEQIQRARQLVENSHEIISRVRKSLDRAAKIQQGICSGQAKNAEAVPLRVKTTG
jgi:hypothetical protein